VTSLISASSSVKWGTRAFWLLRKVVRMDQKKAHATSQWISLCGPQAMSMGTRGRKMAGGRRTILRIAWKLSCYPS
jgi:hypothetical protein